MTSPDEIVRHSIIDIIRAYHKVYRTGIPRGNIHSYILTVHSNLFVNPTPDHPDIFGILFQIEREGLVVGVASRYFPTTLSTIWKRYCND